jgi:hypothetical protein
MREQVVALEHDPDVLAQRVEVDAASRDPLAVDADLALLDVFERVDASEQGRLAAARRSDQAHDLVLVETEAHAAQHLVGPEVLVHVVDLEERAHCACVRSWSRLIR